MSGNPLELPMSPGNHRFSLYLNDKPYLFRQMWSEEMGRPQGGSYYLDIGNGTTGELMIAGMRLVTGTDLLEQYEYMAFGGKLVLTTDRDAGELPTYAGLGTTSRLFFIPDA